jgi:hypothetical protein
MTEGLDLRRFRPEDRPAVVDLHQLALRDAGAFAGRGAWEADLGERASLSSASSTNGWSRWER